MGLGRSEWVRSGQGGDGVRVKDMKGGVRGVGGKGCLFLASRGKGRLTRDMRGEGGREGGRERKGV